MRSPNIPIPFSFDSSLAWMDSLKAMQQGDQRSRSRGLRRSDEGEADLIARYVRITPVLFARAAGISTVDEDGPSIALLIIDVQRSIDDPSLRTSARIRDQSYRPRTS